ncbi:IMPACT family protein [Oryzibacter oryziterrae]|uniref:IMPACT family protein n=1 Tax=Oryzibacter oryziterrae TaxID=2766474 RepID=UPI001F41110C|nr:YigZ family protein [Oryzibacter oryziterrae]
MFRLEGIATVEQVVKKSRFRAIAVPVASEAEAKAALALHGDADANHNCWAFRIGATYRFSDDGEPSGTAGKPILAAIDGAEVDHVLVIVTRWFGGILLGAGGLVRAYGGTAAQCLREAELTAFVPSVLARVHLTFSEMALFKARLAALSGTEVVDSAFDEAGCLLTLRLPEPAVEGVGDLVRDLTRGRSSLECDD